MWVFVQRFGLRDSALGRPRQRLPEWLAKWAALVLQFVEQEMELLPAQLVALQLRAKYTPLTAAAEAKGEHELSAVCGFMHCFVDLCCTTGALVAIQSPAPSEDTAQPVKAVHIRLSAWQADRQTHIHHVAAVLDSKHT